MVVLLLNASRDVANARDGMLSERRIQSGAKAMNLKCDVVVKEFPLMAQLGIDLSNDLQPRQLQRELITLYKKEPTLWDVLPHNNRVQRMVLIPKSRTNTRPVQHQREEMDSINA